MFWLRSGNDIPVSLSRPVNRTSSIRLSSLVIAVIATGLIVAGAIGWKCARDPKFNFLPSDSRAEWIVFPKPVDAGAHRIATIDTVFRRELQLASRPNSAQLQFRAARRVEFRINGKPVGIGVIDNWKDITSVDVTGFLQRGSNKIEARVFNDEGPAALWFLLTTDNSRLRSDNSWEASIAGSAWRHAALASTPRYPQPGNWLAGGEKTFEVLPRVWAAWIGFILVAALVALFGRRLIKTISPKPSTQSTIIICIAVIAWVILFWSNTRLLPFHSGYDSDDHLAYIKYLQEHRALPLPTEGYEMFQAPLYYLLSAGVLSLGRLTVADPGSIAVLRLMTMCFGIAHFVVVFLCLRLLFPTRANAQLVGLALAAFLPMQLYLSHYVTNETLAALLVSLAIYLALRVLKNQQSSIWEHAGLGLCMGIATLAKVTGILLILPLLGALILKAANHKGALRTTALSIAITVIAIFVACGWYYIWIWRHFGTPIVGNWERALGFSLWQDPGFHTAGHYLRFGHALIDPLYSGYNSFGDGIYSTLWGDGLGGGVSDLLSRTPWNYDLMVGGYLLSLIPSLLILIGVVVAIFQFIRRPSAEWFLLIGFSAAVAVAVIFMTLKIASYAQVKAFYGLSLLVPLCAFAAIGGEKFQRGSRTLRLMVGTLLLFWALNSFFSVWILDSATTHLYARHRLARDGQFAAAANQAREAVAKDPSSSTAECFLAVMLEQIGQSNEVIEHTMRGLQLNNADGFCRLQNASNLEKGGDVRQAITIVQQLVDSEPENKPAYDLWLTCARQRRQPEQAIAIARDAIAISPFDAESHYRLGLAAGEVGDFSTAAPQLAYALLLQPSQLEIEKKLHLALVFAAKSGNASEQLSAIASSAPDLPILLDELARILATDPNSVVRNGAEAVRLSERACLLTNRTRPKFLATLAAAYAESGRFSDGVNTAQQAISLARLAGDTSTSTVAEKMLDAFRNGQPYREELAP
jgi:Flp pilus assembly protein TadD